MILPTSSIERLFLCALYGLYLYDCVFWLAPGERGMLRARARDQAAKGWRTFAAQPMSFTLLGRLPVIADPFLLRPGFVRTRLDAVSPATLRKLTRRLAGLRALLTLCRLQAYVLLVYVPVLIVLHRLVALWPIVLTLVLSLHVALCVFATLALRAAKPAAWRTAAASLASNPLGATRAMDIVAQAIFDQLTAPPRSKP